MRVYCRSAVFCGCLVWAVLAPISSPAQLPGLPALQPQQAREGGFEALLDKWVEQFSDLSAYVGISVALLLAMGLAAIIAYHPMTRRKASTIEEVQQPKTFIMYALVGALAGYIAMINTVLGFVIFGIGGLLRFRTDVGEAKDTGRVILVTIVGISCGVGAYLVAVLATLFGWVLIWLLESQETGRVQVKNLTSETIPRAAEAYGQILSAAGCSIVRERKNFVKGQVSFVFKASRDLDREALEGRFKEIPKEIRGVVDWDVA